MPSSVDLLRHRRRRKDHPCQLPPLCPRPGPSRSRSRETLPWLIGAALFGLLLYYFVGIDQGATSVFGDNMYVHELVHDARHLLSFPCH